MLHNGSKRFNQSILSYLPSRAAAVIRMAVAVAMTGIAAPWVAAAASMAVGVAVLLQKQKWLLQAIKTGQRAGGWKLHRFLSYSCSPTRDSSNPRKLNVSHAPLRGHALHGCRHGGLRNGARGLRESTVKAHITFRQSDGDRDSRGSGQAGRSASYLRQHVYPHHRSQIRIRTNGVQSESGMGPQGRSNNQGRGSERDRESPVQLPCCRMWDGLNNIRYNDIYIYICVCVLPN